MIFQDALGQKKINGLKKKDLMKWLKMVKLFYKNKKENTFK